jgi:pSer/pThr/pTyr-binding forkhead associated (FHA) protein
MYTKSSVRDNRRTQDIHQGSSLKVHAPVLVHRVYSCYPAVDINTSIVAARMYLRFIGGQFEGGEFPLKKNREFTIGRGSEHDMVLDEDMVSRAHARISTFDGKVVIEDLGSTNGTLVNGTGAKQHILSPGDQILIGNSLLEFVFDGAAKQPVPVPNHSFTPLPRETIVANIRFMSGKVGDGPLTFFDLLSDMANAKVTGVFEVTHGTEGKGSIYFQDGQITGASVELMTKAALIVPSRKACLRIILWTVARFRFNTDTADDRVEAPLDGQEMIKQGHQEQEMFAKYQAYLPAPETSLVLTSPLTAKLSALSAEVLDTLQIVINYRQVRQIVDHGLSSDFEIYQDILYLLQNGFIEVS